MHAIPLLSDQCDLFRFVRFACDIAMLKGECAFFCENKQRPHIITNYTMRLCNCNPTYTIRTVNIIVSSSSSLCCDRREGTELCVQTYILRYAKGKLANRTQTKQDVDGEAEADVRLSLHIRRCVVVFNFFVSI